MRAFHVLLVILLFGNSGLAQAGWFDEDNTKVVKLHLASGKCEKAVAELNRVMEKRDSRVYFLAAGMYDVGSCVDQDWEKAGKLYQLAYQGRRANALPRLVMNYSKDQRDPAAAMWWAMHKPEWMPADCHPAAAPSASAEFVNELKAWPQDKLAACVNFAYITFRLWDTLTFESTTDYGYMVEVHAKIDLKEGVIEWRDSDKGKTFYSRFESLKKKELEESDGPADADQMMLSLWFEGLEALAAYWNAGIHTNWQVEATLPVERRFRRSNLKTIISVAP